MNFVLTGSAHAAATTSTEPTTNATDLASTSQATSGPTPQAT